MDAEVMTNVAVALQCLHNNCNCKLLQSLNMYQYKGLKLWADNLLIFGNNSILPPVDNKYLEMTRFQSPRHQNAARLALKRMSLHEVVHILKSAIDINMAGSARKELIYVYNCLHALKKEFLVLNNNCEPTYEYVTVKPGCKINRKDALKRRQGLLIPLNCGHNMPLEENEFHALNIVLKDGGWVDEDV